LLELEAIIVPLIDEFRIIRHVLKSGINGVGKNFRNLTEGFQLFNGALTVYLSPTCTVHGKILPFCQILRGDSYSISTAKVVIKLDQVIFRIRNPI